MNMEKPLLADVDFSRKNLLAIGMILSLFVSYKYQNFAGIADFYYHYILYFFVLIFGFFRVSYNAIWKQPLLKFLLITFVSSVFAYFFQPYPLLHFAKQFGGFVFIGFTWLVFFMLFSGSKQKLFSLYVGIALIAAFLTIPEQILHQFDVHLTPKKGGWVGLFRCYSFTEEPFSLALLLLPALSFYTQKMASLTRWGLLQFGVLLTGLFFTFSGAGWLVFGLFLLFNLGQSLKSNNRWLFAFKILVLSSLAIGFFSYSGTQTRVRESMEMVSYFADLPNKKVLVNVNTSTRALYLNSIVAYNQVKQNPLTGGGLGSHGVAYERIVQSPLDSFGIYIAHYNQLDGGSGLIRLLSEFGLVGLFFILYVFYRIIKFEHVSLRMPFALFWMAYLIHSGNYFLHGTFFWLMMLLIDNKRLKGIVKSG